MGGEIYKSRRPKAEKITMIHINRLNSTAQAGSFAEIYNNLFKKILELKAIPEEAQTKSETRHYVLSSKFSRRVPMAFKVELAAKGSYINKRFWVRVKKTVAQADNNCLTSYYVYINSRLRNEDGERINEIGGSGATLEEATNAFIEALQAVKLPPQE